jgi:hypothetical protein
LRTKDKTLVYAEDLIWEIMQYPAKNITKGIVKSCTEKVIAEKRVNIFVHIWNLIKELFTK